MRERPTLPAPSELAGFPAARVPARLHRVCRCANGTWWFSSDGSGRFDLEAPEGTCYFATDLYAAVREASRLGPVTPQWVADREVRVVAPPDAQARLAATTPSFGPAGAGNAPDGERRSLALGDLAAAGVRVLEPPHSAVLTIVRP